jgi:hypothetical protein
VHGQALLVESNGGCVVALAGRHYSGGWWEWVSPFSLLTGASLVAGYALLGAGWLIWKTEGPCGTGQGVRRVSRFPPSRPRSSDCWRGPKGERCRISGHVR